MNKKKRISVLIVCLIFVFGMGVIGSILGANQTQSEWYESIKPELTPPGWIFPLVWNILYLLISLSLWLSWEYANPLQRKKIAIWFGINLATNALWTLFYFGLHRPDLAFIDILVIWITILGMLSTTYQIHKKASFLLIPYLLWVSFAALLNYLSLR